MDRCRESITCCGSTLHTHDTTRVIVNIGSWSRGFSDCVAALSVSSQLFVESNIFGSLQVNCLQKICSPLNF